MRADRTKEQMLAAQRDHALNNKIKELGGSVFADAVLAIIGNNLRVEVKPHDGTPGFKHQTITLVGKLGDRTIFETYLDIETAA